MIFPHWLSRWRVQVSNLATLTARATSEMAAPDVKPSPNATASLPWLVRLRWLTIGGQLAAAAIAQEVVETDVVWWWVSALVGIAIVSNLWLSRAARLETRSEERGNRVMGWVLVQDTVMLTGVLLASGASANPFTILYLVYIVLAALVLDARWTGWLTLLSAVGFGCLFLMPVHESEMHHHGHAQGYSSHLVGMWIAFAVTAAIVAYFVRMISITLESQRTQIGVLRERAAATRHLASLTTLAAGAAHELRTPLATIALAAHELGAAWRRLAIPAADTQRGLDDLQLIEAEVERCQDILWAMRPGFDEEFASSGARPQEILDEVLRGSSATDTPVAVRVQGDVPDVQLAVGIAPAARAVSQLIVNAVDACSNGGEVKLGVVVVGDAVVFVVEDNGDGMSADVLQQATTPFFTTKRPGEGMGLGLFLVQAFALSFGGELRIESTAGSGTRVELSVPISTRLGESEARA